ncbi:hypothetical protein SteCoe_18399 [Stentor coeruleus]|uniref:Uncharacterized protein n=1 Tax=Stentor coeruleus TaxID=5963 RepID=A0A1R2BWR9_9CILI|nr:hypothetical protein SteCoe_18399 [Stentor coeruleus]
MSLSFHTSREVKLRTHNKTTPKSPAGYSEGEISSSSVISAVSDKIKEDEQIEKIKNRNRDLIKKVAGKMMSFKHSSRCLMELSKGKGVQSLIDPECTSDKANSKDNIGPIFGQSFDIKPEVTHQEVTIKGISSLRQHHRRTQSALVENLEKLAVVEQEKNALKRQLNELQERMIFEHKRLQDAKCCNIY